MNWESAKPNAFLRDLETLNVRMPDVYAKATDHIGEIIEMNRTLIERGNAYESGAVSIIV